MTERQRAPGFYWTGFVRWDGQVVNVEPREWNGDLWFETCDWHGMSDEEIVVMSERLTPPRKGEP